MRLKLQCASRTMASEDLKLHMFYSFSTFCSICVYRKEQHEHSSKYLLRCSTEDSQSYGFGTIWGWVFDDWSFILSWTNAFITAAFTCLPALMYYDKTFWIIHLPTFIIISTLCAAQRRKLQKRIKNELQSSSGIIIDGVRGLLMLKCNHINFHKNSSVKSKPQMHQTIHRSHGNMPCSPPHGRLRGNNQCCKSNPNTGSRQRQPNSPINLLQLQR